MSSTEDYVTGAFRSRNEDARVLLDAQTAGEPVDGYDDASDAIAELPLGIDTERHVIITLSTGGPGEWIDVELDMAGDIQSAEFVAVWGSDRRVTRIDETDALWTLAEQYVESFGEG